MWQVVAMVGLAIVSKVMQDRQQSKIESNAEANEERMKKDASKAALFNLSAVQQSSASTILRHDMIESKKELHAMKALDKKGKTYEDLEYKELNAEDIAKRKKASDTRESYSTGSPVA